MVLLFIIKINAISLDGKTYDAEMNIPIITALIKKNGTHPKMSYLHLIFFFDCVINISYMWFSCHF